MNKFVRVFSLAALLLLLTVAVLPAAAQVEVVFNDFTEEFGPGDLPPAELCSGKANDFVGGEIDFKTQTIMDGNGEFRFKLHSRGEFRYQDPVTGEIYVVKATGHRVEKEGDVGEVYVGLVNQRLLLPGPDNNWFSELRHQYVVNSNGDVVVDNFEFFEECR